MGCDVHCHIEVKINGRWEHWSAVHVDRDYRLFARMASVRNPKRGQEGHVVPISIPRGLVNDPSVVTEIAYRRDEPDAHSESWLDGKEMEALCKEFPDLRGSWGYGLGGNGFVAEDDDPFPDCVEDFRVIFWFDN
jgi:hypothetical protein